MNTITMGDAAYRGNEENFRVSVTGGKLALKASALIASSVKMLFDFADDCSLLAARRNRNWRSANLSD